MTPGGGTPGGAGPGGARPLEGTRILSLEQFAAAPYGTSFLADLGAEIVKIENPPSGDPSRYTGPHLLGGADSEYFQSWNTGKKSVLLDLKSPEGREAFHALVAGADAVVNNLRGDLPAALGLDYAALAPHNPAVVCLHISAFGRDNERAARPGYDFLLQAEAGLMSITGEPDGPPTRFGPSIIDYMAGMTGMVGMLSALLGARRTGRGCDVDTCLFDVALFQLSYTATWFLNNGEVTGRMPRSSHFSLAPVQTVPTSDGWVFVMCMTEKFWRVLATALDRTDLLADPRFATAEARRVNREALGEVLDGIFRTDTTANWVARLGDLLPVGPVNDLEQALNSPFVARTGMVRTAPHPANPELKLLANPIRIDGVRAESGVCAPLGADTDAVLRPAPRPVAQPMARTGD